MLSEQLLNESEPVHIGHLEIRDHDVDVVLLVNFQRGLAITGKVGLVTGVLDHGALEEPVHLLVVDDQHACHGITDLRGQSIEDCPNYYGVM